MVRDGLSEVSSSISKMRSLRPAVKRHVLRKCWATIHLCLGLVLGSAFVLSSLTGSTLVFYKAFDEWLNPELLTSAGIGSFRPLSEILAAARTAGPPNGHLETLRFPEHDHGTFLAWYKIPADASGVVRRFQVRIDPYTAAVISRDREWGRTLVSFLYVLHKSWWLEKLGETMVGFTALFLMVSVGTGVYLWWPRPGKLRQALKLPINGTAIQWHCAFHKLIGLYSAVILFILAITGVYQVFPSYVIPLVRTFSPVHEVPKERELQSVPPGEVKSISVEEAVASARQVFPEAELKYLAVPHDEKGVFRIVMRQQGEVRKSSGQSQVWIDQYSGEVLAFRDWRTFTSGEIFLTWLFPLHNGEAFGLPGRWTVFVAGFIPLILFLTGLRIWWLKRLAYRRQKEH